eukprot:724347-Prorocentrum_minimum.AAC.3
MSKAQVAVDSVKKFRPNAKIVAHHHNIKVPQQPCQPCKVTFKATKPIFRHSLTCGTLRWIRQEPQFGLDFFKGFSLVRTYPELVPMPAGIFALKLNHTAILYAVRVKATLRYM